MKVDFRKIGIKGVDGKIQFMDLSKELGNVIFQNTKDIGELDFARDIYHKGEIDVTKEQAQKIKGYVDSQFKAFVKEALFPPLDKIINGDFDKVKQSKK
jgi:hypothetical protein